MGELRGLPVVHWDYLRERDADPSSHPYHIQVFYVELAVAFQRKPEDRDTFSYASTQVQWAI